MVRPELRSHDIHIDLQVNPETLILIIFIIMLVIIRHNGMEGSKESSSSNRVFQTTSGAGDVTTRERVRKTAHRSIPTLQEHYYRCTLLTTFAANLGAVAICQLA